MPVRRGIRHLHDLLCARVDRLLDWAEDRTRCWECIVDGQPCGRECKYSSRPVLRDADRAESVTDAQSYENTKAQESNQHAPLGRRTRGL